MTHWIYAMRMVFFTSYSYNAIKLFCERVGVFVRDFPISILFPMNISFIFDCFLSFFFFFINVS